MIKRIFPKDQLNYILRFYLPTWNYEAIRDEAIRFCEETGTKFVMLFTDAQHMVWNQLTVEEARKEAANIARAVHDFGEHGIRVGINSSYNMVMSRFDHTKHNPQYKTWATLADGTCEKRSPCLLDPALKEYLTVFYGILAATKAVFVYVDDDHRYIHFGNRNTWGCACELHLAEISRRTGKTWTRETLQKALFEDQKLRKEWITMLGESLEELAKVIEKAVHSVNPEMRVGVMVPCLHQGTAFGYNLPRMLKLFQPDGQYLMRPCIGPYQDWDRMQIIPGLFYMEQIGYLMGDEAEYTPEIETTPFTRFSKSMETIRFHISQNIVNRMPNPAISACGYVGNTPYYEPELPKMLKRERPYFEALIKIAPKRGTRKGIGLRFSPDSAKESLIQGRKNVSDYIWPSFFLHEILGDQGFCTSYEKCNVTFLAGDTPYTFTDAEMKEYLSGNLILDADAAKAFLDRGFGKEIGCEVLPTPKEFGAEHFTDKEFCGQYTGTYSPLKDTPMADVLLLKAAEGTRVLSEITSHDLEKLGDAMTICQNALGGKIAVMNYRLGPATTCTRHVICYQRQYLMRSILNWMDPMSMPVWIDHPACFACQYFDDGKQAFVGLTNTSYDIFPDFDISFADPSLDLAKAQYLREDGELRPLSEIAEQTAPQAMKVRKPVSVFHFVALVIPHK